MIWTAGALPARSKPRPTHAGPISLNRRRVQTGERRDTPQPSARLAIARDSPPLQTQSHPFPDPFTYSRPVPYATAPRSFAPRARPRSVWILPRQSPLRRLRSAVSRVTARSGRRPACLACRPIQTQSVHTSSSPPAAAATSQPGRRPLALLSLAGPPLGERARGPTCPARTNSSEARQATRRSGP